MQRPGFGPGNGIGHPLWQSPRKMGVNGLQPSRGSFGSAEPLRCFGGLWNWGPTPAWLDSCHVERLVPLPAPLPGGANLPRAPVLPLQSRREEGSCPLISRDVLGVCSSPDKWPGSLGGQGDAAAAWGVEGVLLGGSVQGGPGVGLDVFCAFWSSQAF